MANRYDIIHIDFQASARGANAAIESIRQEAEKTSVKIEDLKAQLAEAKKSGASDDIIGGLDKQKNREEKNLRQLQSAMNELIKGMRVLDMAVTQFNSGSLGEMNAAFQKSAYNAAKLAQSKMTTGTQEWREMGVIMQETEQNYTRMQRDTAQLIDSLQNGGTVFRKTLEDEKKGLQDLLQVLPYMGTEYRKAQEQLDFFNDKLEALAVKERQARGEIVTTEDAMRVANQLTEEGAKAAQHRAEAADKEIEGRKRYIASLEEERAAKEKTAKASAEQVAKYHEDLQMYDDLEGKIQKEIDAENKRAETKKRGAIKLREESQQLDTQVEEQRAIQEKANKEYDEATTKVNNLTKEIEEMKASIAQSPKTNPVTENIKTGAEEATKSTRELNKEIKQLNTDIKSQEEALAALKARREEILKNKGSETGSKSPILSMTKEQAQAEFDKMNATSAIKINTKGDISFSNLEQVQQKIFALISAAKGSISNGKGILQNNNQINDFVKRFQEIYGFKGEPKDAMKVIKRLLSGEDGGLLKKGIEQIDPVSGLHSMQFNRDDEAWKARIEKTTQLNGIIKGTVDVTQQATQANKDNADSEKELATIDAQLSTIEGQMNANIEKRTQLEQQKADAKKKSTKATQEEVDKSSELAAKEKELAGAQQEQADKLKAKNAEQEKTIKLEDDAKKKAEEAGKAEKDHAEKLEGLSQKMQENNDKRQATIDQNKDLLETNKQNQEAVAEMDAKIKTQADKIHDAEVKKAQAQTDGIEKTEQAIRILENENRTIDTNSEKWETNTRTIQTLKAALDEMKGKPALMMMEERMSNLDKLSAAAVTETKRFWEAMVQGGEQGSAQLAQAEAHLKAITEEERKRSEKQAGDVINNMGSSSDKEIADAVKTFEQLRDAQAHGNAEWQKFNDLAQQGKEQLEKLANTDALTKMEENMANLATLSDAARAETKKFFETMKAGAEQGSEELKKAEANLKAIKDLEKSESEIKAQKILTGTLGNFSESEIREYIDAAQAFRKELASGDPAAKQYAEAIAKAEAHVKKYGVEAARAAQQQAESNKIMANQLDNIWVDFRLGVGMPSESQLKAQRQYWQRLIDDPKTAANSLQQYRDRLAEVEQLEKEMVEINGKTALAWFGQGSDKNASSNKIKEMADKLKEYRGTLLQETNADEIHQIDAILQKVGMSAKKAAEDLMDFEKAKELALQAGDDLYGSKNPAFLASPEQIQAATKSIEKYREELFKTIKQKRDMGEATDAEEKELQELAKYLNDLKFAQDNFNMSREKMEALMKNPVDAVNLDELRSAIKRADGELKRMEGSLGKNSEQYKAFAEQVRNAKNTLKEMEGQARASATAWEKAWSRLKTYVVMYMGFNAVWQKVTGTASDLMDLSDKMGEVRKTTGFTADEVGRLSDTLKKMDTRTTITGLLDLSVAAGQLGLKTEDDVQGFTEAANKLMVALPEMGKEGATQMLKVALATGEIDKIRKQMEQGLIDGSSATAVAMEKVGSTIDRLRATSAATAPAITDFVKRVGAVGAQSGISIDQIAALGSTVDALGMRVEMSATALSRMIPAIKNNAFAVAKAIKVEPNVLRNLFETGRGMEAILMIFQHIKDSGMGADSIEKLLGIGGMQDVMKELNQQGARAGIVFAGLSQNVDTLRSHLETARKAYEENTAIQQEYDKMNETTAAKWERFKNEIEEMFIGDTVQRALGGIIDAFRFLVNVITGSVDPALKSLNILVWTATAYFATWKLGIGKLVAEGFGLLIKGLVGVKNAIIGLATAEGRRGILGMFQKAIGVTRMYIAANWTLAFSHDAAAKAAARATLANNALAKSMNANIWLAVAAAVAMLIYKLHEWSQKAKEAAREAAKFQAELDKETKKVDTLFESVGKATVGIDDANKKVEEANKALKKAQQQADGSKESTDRLTKAEKDLAVAEEELKNKQAVHAQTIQDINTQYSSYLGYMLSEVSSAQELASARELINDKLRETITLKKQEAGLERVENEYGKDRDDAYASLWSSVKSAALSTEKDKYGNRKQDSIKAARVINEILRSAQNKKLDRSSFEKTIKDYFSKNGVVYYGNSLLKDALNYYDKVVNIRQMEQQVIDQNKAEREVNRETSQVDFVNSVNAAFKNYNKLLKTYQEAKGQDRAKAAADVLKEMDTLNDMKKGASSHYDLTDPAQEALYQKQLKGLIEWNGYSRRTLLKEAGGLYSPRKDINGEITPHITDTTNNGWGSGHEDTSTDWKSMTAEQLVARRKQMKEFVNAIQDDTDVTRVLKEDSALQKAIEKGMSRDVRTVIEWYNTERLKIQDELHARHLTNTGDWMDPKKSKSRRKMLHDETRAFIDELDAYYNERKAKIQEAGNEEGLTEAEIKNRTLANDMEWRQRRMELEKMYADKAKEVTQDEQDAIFAIIAERTDDDVTVIKGLYQKTMDFVDKIEKMNEQGAKEAREFRAKMDKQSMQDFVKEQAAIHQQMKAIQDIIDKERPFNGITKNLRENLVTMGILTADMTKERDRLMKEGADMADFNARQAAEELKRTTFILGEAEHAYTSTIEDIMRRMADAGMTAWAEELRSNPKMQEGLMAQLHATYDSIQEAIKKEASLMKKQAENMWNSILLPGGDGKTTLKDAFEKTISQLGIDLDRVNRANGLIGAGASSERVADKLAIKQMQLQLTMQQHYYKLMKKQGRQRIDDLERQAIELEKQGELEKASRVRQDKAHAEMSLRLAMTKEQTDLLKQQEDIIARTEESQNRLYKELKEWGDLLANSMREVMEASNAGNAEYYNERAKLELTGKGGPGAGTYIVIDNEGTEDARAHYEYLDERAALERQHEIEQQNAQAEAWRKVMDDLNQKMNEQITDWMNAALQNQSVDANTTAVGLNTSAENANTEAIQGLTAAMTQPLSDSPVGERSDGGRTTEDNAFAKNKGEYYPGYQEPTASEKGYAEFQPTGNFAEDKMSFQAALSDSTNPVAEAQQRLDAYNMYKDGVVSGNQQMLTSTQNTGKEMVNSSQSTYAKMSSAANLYGIAYQTMTNDNLSTTQKFEMFALQAAGQAAIGMLTTNLFQQEADNMVRMPGILGKLLGEMPYPAAMATYAAVTALLGGLMGLAVSKVTKSKSQIAQVTGASGASAGRLTTGMLQYAGGNVNEFTDPSILTEGRMYNVDAKDGKTYRAKYMGKNARTHITNGPEFHLVGEKGREAIIDAHTTRNIQLNEPEIWGAIKTLYNGGSLRHSNSRRGRGVRAFADGNMDEFENVSSGESNGIGFDPAALQASLDRNSEVMEQIVQKGIKAVVSPYGPEGIVAGYDKYKKQAERHGEKY